VRSLTLIQHCTKGQDSHHIAILKRAFSLQKLALSAIE